MSLSAFDTLLSVLGDVTSRLAENPAGREVLEDYQAGRIDIEQAAQRLTQIAQETGLLPELQAIAENVNSMAPGFQISPAALEEAQRPVVMQTSTNLPQLNPVYEGYLAERVSLDGDVPQLRSGPLPPEGRPAVPVVTDSRDPVIIGLMLEKASNEVRHELLLEAEAYQDLVQNALQEAKTQALQDGEDPETALTVAKKNLPLAPVGVPGYMPGTEPEFRAVAPPGPLVTAAMNEDFRRVAVFQVLATTQGRTSAAPVIEGAVRDHLEEEGITLAPPGPLASLVGTRWTVVCFGPQDLSDVFNPIQNAIEHMHSWAAKHIQISGLQTTWGIRVEPYNDGIADREFGWKLFIQAGGDA